MDSLKNIPFTVKENDCLGRYVVANYDLKPGDVIIEETPFAYGPKADSPPVCLGCYSLVDCTIICSSCEWPVCCAECELTPSHKYGECSVFSNNKVKFQSVQDISAPCLQYECITPLRVLLAMDKDPKRWNDEVACMESHETIRIQKPIWEFNRVNIVEYLRGPCKLTKYSEELIHKVCGILEINVFEARTLSGNYIRCLYPKFAMFSHNCVSNTTHCIRSNEDGKDLYKVTVRPSVLIKQGSELSSSYTYSLWPTLIRREHLKESKYFDCKCLRCADPTELGTHMSSLKCTKCDNGVIMSTDPLDPDSEWKCSHCVNCLKGTTVNKVFKTIQNEIDKIEYLEQDASAIEAREQLYRSYRSVLHPRNAYFTILRVSLAQMYGKVEGYTMDLLPDILLERKIELCKYVLDNINVIEPGYKRLRGMMLYELHAPLIMLARSLYNSDCINKEELRTKLQEAIKLLEESSNILGLEPEETVEGMIGAAAKQALQQLSENLNDLVDNA